MSEVATKKVKEGPLGVSDFEQLEKGDVVHLWYWTVNRGNFFWRHDHVEGDRVFGSFYYGAHGMKSGWSEVSDYLYEFGDYVCRGSGAEPVHGSEPAEVFEDCL